MSTEIKHLLVGYGQGFDSFLVGYPTRSPIEAIEEKEDEPGTFLIFKKKTRNRYLWKEIRGLPVEITYKEPK